jgi:Fur family transcriptional regulator, ferric uptake regulator
MGFSKHQENIEHEAKVHAEFDEYLVKLGLRQTKQRKIILNALMRMGAHVDAETVATQSREIDSSIGTATVYRTLALLTQSGILKEHQFGHDKSQFELAGGLDDHHDHLICNQCGKIFEFCQDEIETLQTQVAEKLGFFLKEHRMELFADCRRPNCENKK